MVADSQTTENALDCPQDHDPLAQDHGDQSTWNPQP